MRLLIFFAVEPLVYELKRRCAIVFRIEVESDFASRDWARASDEP
jgi:hypothetical protein